MLEQRMKERLRKVLLGAVYAGAGITIGWAFRRDWSVAAPVFAGCCALVWAALNWD